MMLLRSVVLLALSANAQFACTFSGAKDSSSCVATLDGKDHCVWCDVHQVGFCISESQAEAMEETVPGVECDRYSGGSDDDENDDDGRSSDDAVDDDLPRADDDDVPDNFWECLQIKDAKKCQNSDCTWCDTKGGFSLCMAGPTADSAADSDWFTCKKQVTTTTIDTSCVQAYLDNPTVDGCTSAIDQTGAACQWCNLNGVTNICLTEEQAEISKPMGLSCSSAAAVTDPYDPACAIAYLEDSSAEACKAAVDANGEPCEYCTLQGSFNICLNEEQAEMGEQFGLECDEEKVISSSPYDTTCLVAFLKEESADDCLTAVDVEGRPCELCSVQGLNLCLTQDQASTSSEMGFTCRTDTAKDMYDPSCMIAYLEDPSADGCAAAVDSDGEPCEYCELQGLANFCLNDEQAEMAEAAGASCGDSAAVKDPKVGSNSLYDTTCLAAFVKQGPSGCLAAVDEDGHPCEMCSVQGLNLCLTQDQASASTEVGFTCSKESVEDMYDPSCMIAYIQDPSADGCAAAVDSDGEPCEYCELQGLANFCLNDEQAEMAEAAGASCGDNAAAVEDPYDPSCALAYLQDPSQDGCESAQDADGNNCQFCNVAGSINICLNEEQAEMAAQFGAECGGDSLDGDNNEDPFDPTCAIAYLQDPSDDGCKAAVDAEGSPCKFCSLQGFDVCLNQEQAEMGEQVGLTCDNDDDSIEVVVAAKAKDPYDPSCAIAYLQDPTADGCTAAMDADGVACEYCTVQGAFSICLNQEQAEMGEQFGLECDAKDVPESLPNDLLECLETPSGDDCGAKASCTWCNTQVGMSFCLSTPAAELTNDVGFFDCDFMAEVSVSIV